MVRIKTSLQLLGFHQVRLKPEDPTLKALLLAIAMQQLVCTAYGLRNSTKDKHDAHEVCGAIVPVHGHQTRKQFM